MTSADQPTSTDRIYEAAQKISADIYLCVNGDEPLMEAPILEQVIPESGEDFFASNLMTQIHSPVEAIDETNIKVVTDQEGYALFMSRSPIPHPKASMTFDYYKHLAFWHILWMRCVSLQTQKKECLRQLRTLMNCVLLSTENN